MLSEISGLTPFAKGKRGIISTGEYKGRKVCVKQKNPKSDAPARIAIEGTMLAKANTLGIGPKLIFCDDDSVVYYYVPGQLLEEFVNDADKEAIISVLQSVFLQCFKLDELGYDKEEMHHPFKHVLIDTSGNDFNVVMLDFERMHYSTDPKNVTQFCQCVVSKTFGRLLTSKGLTIDKEKMLSLASSYKKKRTKELFEEIVGMIS